MKKLLIPGVLLVVVVATTLIFLQTTKTKTAYVDLQSVYQGFGMKKEIEKELEAVLLTRKNYIDSLSLTLQVLRRSKGNDTLERAAQLESYILNLQDKFSEDQDKLEDGFNEKVWSRLNELTRQYGEEQGYDFIFGAQGNGSIMFADSSYNVSRELIKYVNEKYEGK